MKLDYETRMKRLFKELKITILAADMGKKWAITADIDNTAKLLVFLSPDEPLGKTYIVDRVESDRDLVSKEDYQLIYGDKEVMTIYGELA